MINNIQLNPFAIAGLLIAFTCLGLVVILFRYGTTKVHRLWILFNLSVGIWGLGEFFIGVSPTKELAILSWRFALFGGILVPVFFFHVVNVFCENLNKKAIFFAYVQGIIFVFIFELFIENKHVAEFEYLFNSIYFIRAASLIFKLLTIIWFGFVIWGHYKLFRFYKIANELKRKQIIYFFFGMFTGFAGGSMNFLPFHYIDIYPYGNFLIPIYCIIVTYAILKHQLMDINIVIRKGIAYSILITVFTIFYLLIIILTERSFQRILGYRSILISILFASIIALIFIPLKNKIQSFIDKIFLGKSSEQIAQENELLRQELLRSEKLKAVAALASGMAHEIKNPLTAIKTFTEYLSQKKDDKEFLEKFSKIVGSEVDKIDDLVHQLLDFSKPAPLQLKETDIHKLIDDTLELLSSQFIKYRINVIRNFNADTRISNADKRRGSIEDLNLRELALDSRKSALNNISSACISKIDSNQMKQVFLNLFLNATEAMPSGGTLTVSTNLRSSDSKSLPEGKSGVLISVQDTGCGIPVKDLPHIFEPFYTTKENGSGLGLSIVYNIIKEHGGKITVQGEVKQGTKFIIELPLN